MTDMANRSTDGWPRMYLDELGEVLTRRGFRVETGTSATGVPALQVTNRQVPLLSETILCAHEPDGTLALYGEWGQHLTSAADTTTAAVIIGQVLASRDA